ncbi:hypothetical protein [Candidatus Bathycorpusculum sp.]|uniref:hypothetical protein n=1 Tax=Candidatus Bathycorpusculum sp. TaxID=2994959 RepID=UPI00282A761E|nr:alkaline shock response membrane anchor protein AmaP [Candidatus Termitimicrobium sp.]
MNKFGKLVAILATCQLIAGLFGVIALSLGLFGPSIYALELTEGVLLWPELFALSIGLVVTASIFLVHIRRRK